MLCVICELNASQSICVQASTVDSSSLAHTYGVYTEPFTSDCKAFSFLFMCAQSGLISNCKCLVSIF